MLNQAKHGSYINASNEAEANQAFNKSVDSIRKHNMDNSSTYKQKIGEAAGMTEQERNVRRGFKSSESKKKLPTFPVTISNAPNFLNLTRYELFLLKL